LDGSVQTLTSQGLVASPKDDILPTKDFGFVVDTKPDLTVGEVRPWLFISSQDVPNQINLITTHGITDILSLLPGFVLNSVVEHCIKRHLLLEVYDELNFRLDSELISKALLFIKDCNNSLDRKVLVHCNAGVSRAPSIVIMYLMKYENLSYSEAWEIVKTARPIARPNDGFLRQLNHSNNPDSRLQ